MGCGGTACCRICVFSDCSLWICSGGGSSKQGWGGGEEGKRENRVPGGGSGTHTSRCSRRSSSLRLLFTFISCCTLASEAARAFFTSRYSCSVMGPSDRSEESMLCAGRGAQHQELGGWGGGLGGGEGAAAHPCAVVAGRVAQQLLVRVLVGGDAVVVVLVVQVTLAPQRIVEGICGAGGGSAGAVGHSHPPLLPPPAAPILTRGAERALPLLPALGFPQDIDEQSGKLPGVEPGQLLPALGWRGDKSSEGGSEREKGGLSGALGSPGCGWRSTRG